MRNALEHYLSPLFSPNSVAVFGASERSQSVASLVLNNIIENGFKGDIYPINPKYSELYQRPCFANLEAVNAEIELAIIATPARTIPAIMDQCGENGVKHVVILSAGFRDAGEQGLILEQRVIDKAHHHGIRFIGPNCLGVISPYHHFNATFASGHIRSGNMALISQSGALCTAILDWAENQDIGFSAVVSMGISVDVDFGELLDYLVADPKTHSILMYVEGIRNARAFMSGLRAAARVKPVIVVKAGRHQASVNATASHTGALVCADDVFDAALRRAGVVRGMHIGDLFAAATVLARGVKLKGDKLALITNGGGPAAMACDKASDLDIPMSRLDDSTIEALSSVLPPMWSHNNPVDILGDADVERYDKAIRLVLDDKNTNGAIVLLTPQAMTEPTKVAERVIAISKTIAKPILTCWMGERQVHQARQLLSDSGIPSFRLPETAVQGFSYLTNFYRNQKLLLQTPTSVSDHKKPDIAGAKLIINNVLAEKRKVLTEAESKAILSAFHIPVAPAVIARSAIDAIVAAENMGFPIVMKIHSRHISHKSDIGGVRLNISSAAGVQRAYIELMDIGSESEEDLKIEGVVVEPMVRSSNGRELLVGISTDAAFGPVVTFGSGGSAVALLADKSVSLPPLNRLLANDMIARTRVARLLNAYRDKPAVNLRAIEDVLIRVSEIACELPEVMELDINPLIADNSRAIAVDARIIVNHHYVTERSYSHTAIHPYPGHLKTSVLLAGGINCSIRPIRPEDAELEREFVENLSDSAKRYRFMNIFRKLPPEMLAKFTQIDYDREMALIAIVIASGEEKEIGVSRYTLTADGKSCEFAIAVADNWQGKGVAHSLMDKLIEYARYRGIRLMIGEVLSDNQQMLKLARKLGFKVKHIVDDQSTVRIEKIL